MSLGRRSFRERERERDGAGYVSVGGVTEVSIGKSNNINHRLLRAEILHACGSLKTTSRDRERGGFAWRLLFGGGCWGGGAWVSLLRHHLLISWLFFAEHSATLYLPGVGGKDHRSVRSSRRHFNCQGCFVKECYLWTNSVHTPPCCLLSNWVTKSISSSSSSSRRVVLVLLLIIL